MKADADSRVILVVDDDDDDWELLNAAAKEARVAGRFERAGGEAEAWNWIEGTNKFADRDRFPLPSLLLLDLKMAGDGLQLLRRIRTHPGSRLLPVVALTASAQLRDIQAVYDAGANAYLVKPSDFADLRRMMEGLDLFWLRFNQYP